MAVIGIIATLDTKGPETAFLRDRIEEAGHKALILDSGMLFPPAIEPDISRHELLAAAGVDDLEAYRANGKAALQKAMSQGVRLTLQRLAAEGKIQGVLSVGGGQGSAMSSYAMQGLPVGFPKVLVSTVACGTARFGDYVGNRDIVMIPSISDICGLNAITVPIFSSGVGAVVGMVEMAQRAKYSSDKPVIGLTMAGVTTECVMRLKEILDERGYETIVCHCNVVGAVVLDELAAEGKIAGVIDVTPHDVGGYLYDGLMAADEHRFENIYAAGIPVITAPGAVDFQLKGPVAELPEELKGRAYNIHTPFHTHVRASYEDMYRVGTYITEKHNGAKGPNAIMVPLRGYSQQNREGRVLYDEHANQGFTDAVKAKKADNVLYIEKDMHINDPEFALALADEFEKLYKGE